MNKRAVAIHEASHAVAGVCLGRLGLLKKVSVVPTPEMKGGCHWDVTKGRCPPDEQGQEIGICCAGPVGQVLYASDSLGEYASLFRETIFQSERILEDAGCAGRASTDLLQFITFRRWNRSISLFTEVEAPLKSLLNRPSVGSAIRELASSLELYGEIEGSKAEEIIRQYLLADDYVGKEYLA